MMNCDNGTNASLSLSLSSEDKSCWIVRFLGEFVKVGDQVPQRRAWWVVVEAIRIMLMRES
jgi:hypothetical protein